ncbi:MAG TPA: SCO family protein [Micropepsaceae bacterium]|nr:SCO family protein [Micropepsaceae bacterium]
MRAALALIFVVLASLMLAQPHRAEPAAQEQELPKIAPAPEFALISQDGASVKLADYRGKVVAVTFIFTLCADTCPVLTPMMSFVQDQLGADFGEKIHFVSITVDPERDTLEVLKEYAQAFGANLSGWAFLTGTPDAIRDVTRRYGIFAAKTANGSIDHTFLTSIIDQRGILRVQYLGVRFDPEEFRRDLVSLLK